MKVLLVNPDYASFEPVHVVHMGLAYLGAVIEKEHDVAGVDLNVEPESKFVRLVKWSDVVCFTATTITISRTLKLVRLTKTINRRCRIILGGPHPTCSPVELLEENTGIDFVTIGEGEVTIVELLRAIENNGDLRSIKGIGYRNGKKTVITKPREMIKDLDGLPLPAYDIFDESGMTSYEPHVTKKSAGIVTSRGCPYACKYCFKGLFGRQWRKRSVESIVNEWRWLVKERNVEQIAILDDVFNLDIQRVKDICDRIVEEGLQVPWLTPNGIRADFVDKEMLEKMKASGCYRIAIGIETGDERVMEWIGKRLDMNKVRETVRLANEVGLEITGFFILGLPPENEETMNMTIDLACELDLDFAQFTMANPFLGTELYDIVKEQGTFTKNWREQFGGHFDDVPNFVMGELTAELLLKMRRRAYWRFYMRPRIWRKHIHRISSTVSIIRHIWHYLKR